MDYITCLKKVRSWSNYQLAEFLNDLNEPEFARSVSSYADKDMMMREVASKYYRLHKDGK